MKLLRLFICLLAWRALHAQPAKEPEFCALRITIFGGDGTPFRTLVPMPVRIVSSDDGSVWREFKTTDGKVEVCDVDPELFDVVAGWDRGPQVVVRRLQLYWGRTVDLHVIVQNFNSLADYPPWNGCSFLVKVRDPEGRPVQHSLTDIGTGPNREADQYGRIAVNVRAGETTTMRISATGFRDSTVSLGCPKGYRDERMTVVLEPASAAR